MKRFILTACMIVFVVAWLIAGLGMASARDRWPYPSPTPEIYIPPWPSETPEIYQRPWPSPTPEVYIRPWGRR